MIFNLEPCPTTSTFIVWKQKETWLSIVWVIGTHRKSKDLFVTSNLQIWEMIHVDTNVGMQRFAVTIAGLLAGCMMECYKNCWLCGIHRRLPNIDHIWLRLIWYYEGIMTGWLDMEMWWLDVNWIWVIRWLQFSVDKSNEKINFLC